MWEGQEGQDLMSLVAFHLCQLIHCSWWQESLEPALPPEQEHRPAGK